MIEAFFTNAKALGRLRANSFGSGVDYLAEYLNKRRYSPEVGRQYVRAAVHFSYWLKTRHIPLHDVNEATVDSFLSSHLQKCFCYVVKGGPVRLCRSALNHFLNVLRDKHLVDVPQKPISPTDKVLHDFGKHMIKVHGTTLSTVRAYSRHIGEFLKANYADGPIELNRLDANKVREYVTAKAKGYESKTTQLLASSLRTFFRFLTMTNQIEYPLEYVVPTVAHRRLSTIPKYLTEEQLGCFLSSFDLSTPIGLRDHAMALLMARIGLRAGEVAQLNLEDLNWPQGIIMIKKTKSRQATSLPLPKEVGEALVAYLKKGRPYNKERYIFVTHTLPVEKPLSALGVVKAIIRAFKRCALPVPFCGSHVMRDTLATRLLQKNATLKEIADILRHRSIETTNIYAKVDLTALVEVALPWPEVMP